MKEDKLFKKDFTLVVIGQIISLFGNAILRFALPLYLLRTTGSASLFGIVTACSFLPMIVLSLLGGVLADRVNKRNIMVGLDFGTAVLMIVFSLFIGKLPIVPLFIVTLMLLYGISGTYQPAVQASMPVLASEKNLLAANATINQISSLAGLLGPVVGGILYGAFGITPILIISIICFTASAVMEIFIKIPFEKKENSGSVLSIVKADLSESLQFVCVEKPVFIKVIVIIAAFNLILSAMIIVGIPVIIVEILGLGDALLGSTQGALALGGLAGGIYIGMRGHKMKLEKGYLLLISSGAAVFLMGIVMLISPSPYFSYAAITVLSFLAMSVSTMFSIQMLSTVQAQTPPNLVGKVVACLIAIAMCAQPAGQAVYGFLFEYFREQSWAVLVGAAVVSMIVGIYSKATFRELENQK